MHLILAAAMLAAATGPDDNVKVKLLSEGGMSKIGNYAPLRIKLAADKPATLTKMPEGLKAPQFGVIQIAGPKGATYHVVLDEPEGAPATLLIDANGDGDLSNDPAAKWEGKPAGKGDAAKFTQYGGSCKLNLGTASEPFEASLGMYRFDKNDPNRAALKDVLLYYRDYAITGDVVLGEKTYTILLNDNSASGDFRGKELAADADENATSGVNMLIDVNGNGKFDKRGESFDVRKPFNIGGVTYEIANMSSNGLSFKVIKSSKTVAAVPLAPDHSVGKTIMSFEAPSTDGKTVRFPSDYKGKIVMIDFWATWCGPCMKEVPGLVKAYEKYHAQGFEVLGVSLDNEKSVEKLKPVTEEQGMKWTQICDAKGWKAAIAQQYVVDSIPACWLVDGDTGEILATGGELRGEQLAQTIERALLRKKGS